VGVTSCKFNNAENVGFAIPSDDLFLDLEVFAENKDLVFSVKCPSCGHLMFEKLDFCPNCGHDIDEESIFQEPQLSPVGEFVESAIQGMGFDPVVTRGGYDYWEFYQGSALIRIFISNRQCLYATSPLVKLPKQKLLELYTYMVNENNALTSPEGAAVQKQKSLQAVRPFIFGLDNNIIYLSYRLHLSDIQTAHQESLKQNLVRFVQIVDEQDDFLMEYFGCERSEESRMVS